ncbi:MAG: protein tyrosine phosphatase [Lachnospiraceae bacterium]|jgi:protein-tyrosine phosphatase|nr:protein tyrosine phosphatase [Lachnospiraceae bacterium]
MNMIDIHCHILPGLDDGARNLAESNSMLRKAADEGITAIIATPHFYPGRDRGLATDTHRAEEIRRLTANLQSEATAAGLGISVFAGNELYGGGGLARQLGSGAALTLAGSRYILVEYSPMETYSRMYQSIKALVERGYLLILAHFERYRCLTSDADRIGDLKNMGVYLQMNLASLLGGVVDLRARFCRNMVLAGDVDFLATDAHRMDHRPIDTAGAKEWLRKKLGDAETHRLLHENPQHIIRNEIL